MGIQDVRSEGRSNVSPNVGAPRAGPARPLLNGIADEEDRLPRRPLQWLLLMVASAVVGAAAGLAGAGFRSAIFWLGTWRTSLVAFCHLHAPPWAGWAIPTGLCALGAGVGSWISQRFAPQTAGSGVPRVEAVLRAHLRPAKAHLIVVKFLGGALSIGSGLALGREGPIIQMGGTLGRYISDGLRRFFPEPWTLIAAGAGAGLGVAFNAPLAAVVFVAEELLQRFSARAFSATLVACITGALVLRGLLGGAPDFNVAPIAPMRPMILPMFLLLGMAAGLLGAAFNVTLIASLRLFDHAARWPRGAKGALVGAAAGLVAWFAPVAVGGGESLAQSAITGHFLWGAIVCLLILRFGLTMASYGCGAPGGIFAPLLALGALLGAAFGAADAGIRHVPSHPAAYAIVAMAALFTAVVRSPLTGVVLLLEMTGSWTLILPMMAASIAAYAIPELLGIPPIYDTLRARDEAVENQQMRSAPPTAMETEKEP